MSLSREPWKQVVEEFEIRTVSMDNRITAEVRCVEGLEVKLDYKERKIIEEILKTTLIEIQLVCYRKLG